MFERKGFILKTYRPGWVVADPTLDSEFKDLLDLKKAGKLRSVISQSDPDRAALAHSAYNFHENHMWMDSDGSVKKEVKIEKLCVSKTIKGPNGEEIPNKEGLLPLDTEDEVIFCMQRLAPYNDLRVSLDLIYGNDLSPEGKERLKAKVPIYYNDVKQTINTKSEKIKK